MTHTLILFLKVFQVKRTALWRHLLYVEVVIYFELEPEYLLQTVRRDTFNILVICFSNCLFVSKPQINQKEF